ncbi:FAD dependent oxidoreductase [Thozetella sp. PMI_491]|nr:FAD dependent oxidoreductase [Thozetella sp. PMI_491]
METDSFIIVGSGVFGASTALYLVRKHPNAHTRLIDRDAYTAPTRVAASWDWNKVVRADYNDIVYTRLALEARELWKNDAVWRDFYHESGIYWISKTGFAETVMKNFEELGVDANLQSCPVDEAKAMYNGVFSDADYSGVKNVLLNKISGYADAKEALRNTIQMAVSLGVEYTEAEVSALVLEDGDAGACKGVSTHDGRTFEANHIILSTGAYTMKLLADSAPYRPSLHAGKRIIAAAVGEAIAPLNEELSGALRNTPVVVQENPTERGASNGYLPPNKDNVLKFWGQYIFSNTLDHPASGQSFSMPPPGPNYDQWNVPKEALTPSEDFIVSPHTSCPNLYIATCGSFHGFKFLPVLGKYVVEMLDGALEPELVRKWAWDRPLPGTEHNVVWPRKELRNLLDA